MFSRGNKRNVPVSNVTHISELISKNGMEEEVESFVKKSVHDIKFAVIIKPAIISLIALIISFFIDLSSVPFFGDVSINIGKYLFPNWKPTPSPVVPFTFWWLPILVYALFLFLAWLAYNKLKIEIVRTPASETIDRIITSYTSVVDSISTALPLIGAAILLISIRLGEAIFVGLSVPFEIKSLIILALGKLFEPVLDQLSVEFQNIVNHVKDFKERYYSKLQIDSSNNILNKLTPAESHKSIEISETSIENLNRFNSLLERTAKLSVVLNSNLGLINQLYEKMNTTTDLSNEKMEQLRSLANSITQATDSLKDEKTIIGLKHLEAIVNKK
jgi:hypothetical protein